MTILDLKVIKMKKILITCVVILFGILTTSAQLVYEVDYPSQADIKVYVVKYESQCDLKVFFVEYESQVDTDGLWYYVKYPNQANLKIYFVEYESQADLKIYYVDYETQAGWKNPNKSHLSNGNR